MHLLVVGGNGLIGRRTCRAAVDHSAVERVTSVSRSGRPADAGEWVDGVRWVAGDALDPAGWRWALRDADSVVHSVGIVEESPKEGVTFERINGDAGVVVGLEAERAGADALVLLSAATKPPRTRDAYLDAKRRAERSVADLDLRTVALRSGAVYGAGDPHFPWLLDRAFALVDRVDTLGRRVEHRPLPVETVGRAALRAALDPTCRGVHDADAIRALGSDG
ncbi:SDR family oxidoreductase [Halobium salinum]|uniref:SDR family oxidoreductase n=1 Tax=Halobium salinum TaxID=1364940 RepID=A0ABD5P8C3_9EURY|nr:NAD-dependent epimerase/dehydratase family protein [Halobium salinum]